MGQASADKGREYTVSANASPAGVPATEAALQEASSQRDDVTQQGGRMEVKLDFSQQPLTDEGIAKLPLNDAVTELDLSGTQITDEGLVHLQRARNLTKLTLANTKVTDAGLEHLKELPNLQWVDLMGMSQISIEAQQKLEEVLRPRRPNY